jgi:hypothetical protein
MAYVPVEIPWYGSFCQHWLVRRGANSNLTGALTTTGTAKQPGLLLAFRQGRGAWVYEELFDQFVAGLTDEEFAHIARGSILFLC